MLTKRIIPCLDILAGQVVKGTHFKHLRKMGEPLPLAARYQKEGADELCFLDINASHEKRKIFLKLVEEIGRTIFIPFTVGGGLSDFQALEDVLLSGADKFSINTAAVNNPQLIEKAAKTFGSQCVVVAIDAKFNHSKQDYEVFLFGGRKPSGIFVREWIHQIEDLGAGEILLTSMDRDGTKLGYDLKLLATACSSCKLPVIASGGVGNVDHVIQAMKQSEAQAFLAASIFHQKKVTIRQLKEKVRSEKIPIRL